MKDWVLSAVSRANMEFGTRFAVKRIQCVRDDSRDAKAFALLACELVDRALCMADERNGYTQGGSPLMTYRGIVSNGVVVLQGEKLAEGTVVDVMPRTVVAARLDELRTLKDGWLDGNGKSLKSRGLDWLAEAFDQRFSEGPLVPHFYPTAEGGIQAEWTLKPWEVSLEIDLVSHVG